MKDSQSCRLGVVNWCAHRAVSAFLAARCRATAALFLWAGIELPVSTPRGEYFSQVLRFAASAAAAHRSISGRQSAEISSWSCLTSRSRPTVAPWPASSRCEATSPSKNRQRGRCTLDHEFGGNRSEHEVVSAPSARAPSSLPAGCPVVDGVLLVAADDLNALDLAQLR